MKSELDEAGGLVPHVSVYELTLEEGTPLARDAEEGKVWLPDDDETAEYLEIAVDTLAEHGLERYEVSNLRAAARSAATTADIGRAKSISGWAPERIRW